jgi:hypothetical protein
VAAHREHAERARLADGLVDEAGLAEPRLSGDQRHPAAARHRAVDQPPEGLPFLGAADIGRAAVLEGFAFRGTCGLLAPLNFPQAPAFDEALQAHALVVLEDDVPGGPQHRLQYVRHQDLFTLGARHDACGRVDAAAEQVVTRTDDLPGMDADAHPHRLTRMRAVVGVEATLDGDRAFDGFAG